jgi:hypothetical protein
VLGGVADGRRWHLRRLFELVEQVLEVGDLLAQRGLPGRGERHPRTRALALVSLVDLDQSGVFQDGQMLAEVAGGQPQGRAQESAGQMVM